jgi:hypothetical protein
MVEQKDIKLKEFLSALNFDVSNLENDSSILPKKLLECCASLSTRPSLLNEIPKLMGGIKVLKILSVSIKLKFCLF